MHQIKTVFFVLLALLLVSCSAANAGPKINIPIMNGMRSTKKMPLSEALENGELCDLAKMGPDFVAGMAEESGADCKVYKTPKSVKEVIDFYADFAKKSGMPDTTPSVWDNSAGKEKEDSPKDSSGQLTFSLNLQNAQLTISIVAFRAEKDKSTTVYVFQPQEEKKK